MKRWYQTDFDDITRRDGCLVFSIIDGLYEGLEKMDKFPRDMSKDELKELFLHAHRRGYMQKNSKDSSFGMYVMNHEGFANEVLSWLLEPEIRCSYIGAHYMPEEDRENWGQGKGNDFLLLQVTTKNGGGHFRRPCYDPWEPSPGIDRIRSVRYYKLREE